MCNFIIFQQVANVVLIFTATLIGLLCYVLGEGKQRRAFVEAKQSLEVKTLIEEQSTEQVKFSPLFRHKRNLHCFILIFFDEFIKKETRRI